MNLFLISLKLKGFPIKKAIDDLKEIKSLQHADFEAWVERKKWEQFDFHKKHNAFYRSYLGSNEIRRWEDIPIITKAELQRPLKQLISEGYFLNDLFVNNTSGSSGTPFFFAKDKYAHAITWANVIDRYSEHGIEYGKSLQARFYGIPLKGLKYYKEKGKDILSARVRFPVFDLSNIVLKDYVKKFARRPFEYINGYTSALVYFAQYLISNKIVLKSICPSLRVVFPTSEMCSSHDREIMERGFGVPVANEYGCAEMDVLAFEDPNNNWTLSEANVFFEVVDDQNNLLPIGSEGNLIITSLHNKAMPLIRYKLGDVAIINPVRLGNKLVLEKVICRTNEFALLPSGKKVPALTFYYITKTLIQQEFGVKEFVVKQLLANTFQFDYVADQELSVAAIQKIKKAMDDYLEPELKALFIKKQKIDRSPSGKFKQFECLID